VQIFAGLYPHANARVAQRHVQLANNAEKPSVTPTTSVIFLGNEQHLSTFTAISIQTATLIAPRQTNIIACFLLPPCCFSGSEGYSIVRLRASRVTYHRTDTRSRCTTHQCHSDSLRRPIPCKKYVCPRCQIKREAV
jgi:hypothetical protein